MNWGTNYYFLLKATLMFWNYFHTSKAKQYLFEMGYEDEKFSVYRLSERTILRFQKVTAKNEFCLIMS